MSRSLVLGSLVLLASACAGSPPGAEPTEALMDVWAAIPVGARQLESLDVPDECDRTFGTWFADFGVRGLACTADHALPLAAVAARAPAPVWTSGPHRTTATSLGLSLSAPREFGRYNPAFVEWAVENAIPESAAARALAQPIYDTHVRRLARVYWLSHQALADAGFPEDPTGPGAAYAAYLDGGPTPSMAAFENGVSVFLLFDEVSQPIAARLTGEMSPPAGDGVVGDWNEWEVRYEANTALGFWVRRAADGTHALLLGGLRDLLATFDADWLASHGG